MMHSALFVVELPDHEQRWQSFIAEVDRLRTQQTDPLHNMPNVARLAENVWLLNFQMTPEPLARLVSAAVALRLSYGILQLDAAPQWLPAGFDPKTIWDR